MTVGFLLLLGGWLQGCMSNLAQPNLEDVQWAVAQGYQTTLQELQQGRALYVKKCAGCHNLHRPDAYSSEEWSYWIDQMIQEEEVDLNLDDQKKIVSYLATISRKRNTFAARN